MDNVTRYRKARQVTILGAVINFFLGVIKVTFGWLGHSQALIADGIHSFSDLITDAVVLFAARYGSQAADQDHPYGHERIETAATVGLAILLIIVAVGIFVDGAIHIIYQIERDRPHWMVLFIAFISIIANEGLYQYTIYVGRQIQSNLLIANAWHHRSDALSSIVVLVGVAGAILGLVWLDAVAAMIVSLMIIRMGWRLGWHSLRELVDTSIDEQMLDEIKQQIKSVNGVQALHQLRTRTMAGKIFVDVHILVASRLSVSEGHYIGEQVRKVLIQKLLPVTDVTVHVDPEDDEVQPLSNHLPQREKMLAILQQKWQDIPEYHSQKDIVLHYLGGKIHVELYLPLEVAKNRDVVNTLTAKFHTAIQDEPAIASLRLLFF